MKGGRWKPTRLVVFAVVLLGLTAGCSDENEDSSGAATDDTGTASGETLEILVTNDDGFDSEGLSVLVDQLQALPNVEVTVVAPADQRSGSGSNTTPGDLATREEQTLAGYPVTAVEGFPADTIRVAFDDLGLTPDVVVSGVNEGQNIGPAIDISGTIGAARAAAQQGVPAVAVSQGLPGEGGEVDYELGAELAVDWVTEHRDELQATPGEPLPEITNINAPSCSTGEVRELVEVPPAAGDDVGAALAPTGMCDSDVQDPADDVEALTNGFATISEISSTPAAA